MRSASYDENRGKTGVLQTSYEKIGVLGASPRAFRRNLTENAPAEYPGSDLKDSSSWRTPAPGGLLLLEDSSP